MMTKLEKATLALCALLVLNTFLIPPPASVLLAGFGLLGMVLLFALRMRDDRR